MTKCEGHKPIWLGLDDLGSRCADSDADLFPRCEASHHRDDHAGCRNRLDVCLTTLTIGHLNILSISFVTILIGLGVDFGIHFLARYIQHRQQGMEIRSALVNTSGRVGVSILTGAITSALAFFCAAFTDFLGVAELGLIAGAGILLCVVATFTLCRPCW